MSAISNILNSAQNAIDSTIDSTNDRCYPLDRGVVIPNLQQTISPYALESMQIPIQIFSYSLGIASVGSIGLLAFSSSIGQIAISIILGIGCALASYDTHLLLENHRFFSREIEDLSQIETVQRSDLRARLANIIQQVETVKNSLWIFSLFFDEDLSQTQRVCSEVFLRHINNTGTFVDDLIDMREGLRVAADNFRAAFLPHEGLLSREESSYLGSQAGGLLERTFANLNASLAT